MLRYFIPRMGASALTVVSLLVLTRVLDPADLGVYHILLMCGATGNLLLAGWLATAAQRFHHASGREGDVLSITLYLTFVQIVALCPLIGIVAFALDARLSELFIAATAYAIAHGIHEFGTSALRLLEKPKAFAGLMLLRPVLGTLVAVWLVAWEGMGALGAVVGMAFGAAAAGVPAMVMTLRHAGALRPVWTDITTFFRFGFPLSLVQSRSMVVILATQFILARLAGLDAVGYFAVAQTIASRTINMPMTNLMRVNAPRIYREFERNDLRSMRREALHHLSFLLLISAPTAVVAVFANQFVAQLLFTEPFASNVAQYLPWLALAAVATGLQAGYFSLSFTLARQTWRQFSAIVATTLLQVFLTWMLTASYDGLGASVAMFLGGTFGCVIFVLVGRKAQRLPSVFYQLPVTAAGLSVLAASSALANQTNLPMGTMILGGGFVVMAVVFWAGRHDAIRSLTAHFLERN